jgi:hypothetical protein
MPLAGVPCRMLQYSRTVCCRTCVEQSQHICGCGVGQNATHRARPNGAGRSAAANLATVGPAPVESDVTVALSRRPQYQVYGTRDAVQILPCFQPSRTSEQPWKNPGRARTRNDHREETQGSKASNLTDPGAYVKLLSLTRMTKNEWLVVINIALFCDSTTMPPRGSSEFKMRKGASI